MGTKWSIRDYLEETITSEEAWPKEATAWPQERFNRWMDQEVKQRLQRIIDDTPNLYPIRGFHKNGHETLELLMSFGIPMCCIPSLAAAYSANT